jgi:CheY-like chemotaxis protein
MRILIVEEVVKLARSLTKGMEAEGYAVDVLRDGLAARRRLTAARDDAGGFFFHGVHGTGCQGPDADPPGAGGRMTEERGPGLQLVHERQGHRQVGVQVDGPPGLVAHLEARVAVRVRPASSSSPKPTTVRSIPG